MINTRTDSTLSRSRERRDRFPEVLSNRNVELSLPASIHSMSSLTSSLNDRMQRASEQCLQDCYNTLRDMLSLQNNWDGNGAIAPSRGMVHLAMLLANHLHVNGFPRADFVVVTPSGFISFEFSIRDHDKDVSMTFEVVSDNDFCQIYESSDINSETTYLTKSFRVDARLKGQMSWIEA